MVDTGNFAMLSPPLLTMGLVASGDALRTVAGAKLSGCFC